MCELIRFLAEAKTNQQQSVYKTLATGDWRLVTSDLRLGPYFKWKIWNENISPFES